MCWRRLLIKDADKESLFLGGADNHRRGRESLSVFESSTAAPIHGFTCILTTTVVSYSGCCRATPSKRGCKQGLAPCSNTQTEHFGQVTKNMAPLVCLLYIKNARSRLSAFYITSLAQDRLSVWLQSRKNCLLESHCRGSCMMAAAGVLGRYRELESRCAIAHVLLVSKEYSILLINERTR